MIYEWKQARKILQIIKDGHQSQEFIQKQLIDPLITRIDERYRDTEDIVEFCFYDSLMKNLENANKSLDYHPGEIRMIYPPEKGLEEFLDGWEFITK